MIRNDAEILFLKNIKRRVSSSSFDVRMFSRGGKKNNLHLRMLKSAALEFPTTATSLTHCSHKHCVY